MPIFDGSQREIGKGAQAVVYLYKGYAYKVYSDHYPAAWINGELLIQNEINKTVLPVVRYYATEEPNILKMDFIDGVTLGDRMQHEGYGHGVADLVQLQQQIHRVTGANIPTFKSYAVDTLHAMRVDPQRKSRALGILDAIPERPNLLHLDFHFLNIMYAQGQYKLIDWINARVGNPIFDFARSYVLLSEIPPAYGDFSQEYMALITKEKLVDSADLHQAIYVCALLRTSESNRSETTALLEKAEAALYH